MCYNNWQTNVAKHESVTQKHLKSASLLKTNLQSPKGKMKEMKHESHNSQFKFEYDI